MQFLTTPWYIGHEPERRVSPVRAAVLTIFLILLAVAPFAPAQAASSKYAAMTVDARNGKILFAENGDAIRHPASLTKMMTLYLLFQDLKSGKIKLNSSIRISARAASRPPSKLGAKPGSEISVETAIRALVIKSANDIATAVAENLGGTETAFAKRMTRTARSIGMSRTTFHNASGLPDSRQVTTARDMATLGLRLMRDFPQYYPYFRAQSFTYKGRKIRGHNRLLGKFKGTDGIKTGYINASGYNLVTSVRRGKKRLVGVVLGGRTGASRNAFMMKMLEKHFRKASNGKTIAASAGSSKGAINPILAAEKPKVKKKKSIFGSTKKEVPAQVVEPTIADAISADQTASAKTPVAEGDTGDSPTDAEALASKIEGINAAPHQDGQADAPKVIESALGKPDKLPFEVKDGAEAPVDGQMVASLPAEEVWSIQIGAYSTKRDAQAQLLIMRKKVGEVLEGKTALTITVQKGNDVTYRARFTGFNQAGARSACKQIEKNKSGCYVLAPAS